jgi:hypothetical protein
MNPRLAQTWHFLRCAARSLFYGPIPAVPDEIPSTGDFIALQRETREYNKRRGLYTRVAQELGVTPAHVRNCALGLRRSSRVEEALLREMSRDEQLQQNGGEI